MTDKFFFVKDSNDGILVRYNLKSDVWLDYEVFEAQKDDNHSYAVSQASSMTKANLDDVNDQLLHGFIKWDGCMQWYCPNNTMTFFHSDGREYAINIFNLIINSIYDLAKEVIPKWHEKDGLQP